LPINSRTDWNARRNTIALTSWKFLECTVHVQRIVSHSVTISYFNHLFTISSIVTTFSSDAPDSQRTGLTDTPDTGRTHTCRRSSDCFRVLVPDAAAMIQREPKSSLKTDAACVCAFTFSPNVWLIDGTFHHLPLPQIFPPIDSLPASGLTPRTSRLDRFF